MDIEAAYSRLPETHAAALRLRGRGFDDDAIAKALAVEPRAVASLLRIAEAKLAALTAMNADESGLMQRRAKCTPPVAECSHLRREIGHLADVSVGVASVSSPAGMDEERRSAKGDAR